MIEHVDNVYQHAKALMREYPHAAGIGVAWTEIDGTAYALACAALVQDSHGEWITPDRMACAPSGDAGAIAALAAIRSCVTARVELGRVLADLT